MTRRKLYTTVEPGQTLRPEDVPDAYLWNTAEDAQPGSGNPLYEVVVQVLYVRALSPSQCPVCGMPHPRTSVEWAAQSDDDPDNKASLTEYQCSNEDCAISFWM